MKRTLLAGAVAATLGLGIVVPAQAAPTPDEQLSAGWLAGEVQESGLVSTVSGGFTFDDHGLSVDVLIALLELDAEPETRARMVAALEGSVLEYARGFDPADLYAGATGKLATVLQLAGRSTDDVDGEDLIALAESTVSAEGDSAGRGQDSTSFGDFSNGVGQSWLVRALSVAGSDLADDTAAYLAKQQCADGSVLVILDDAGCTTGTGDVDGTAFALQAFLVARDNGVAGLDDEISAAVANLLALQAGDGSFANPTPNTNTTGLAANVLRKAGQPAAAARAAGWVFDKQVTNRRAAGSSLTSEIGAIAFDQAALDAGRRNGIRPELRDQWRRATAQAVLALPAADVVVQAPRLGATGSSVDVDVSRLAADEDFELVAGTQVVGGTADATGAGTAALTLPEVQGPVTVTVRGLDGGRTGTATITALAPAEFDVTVTPDVARPGVEVEVGFGESTPVDGEDLDLLVVPVEVVEDALVEVDEEPIGPRALSADQVDALDRDGLEAAAVETLDVQEGESFEVEAPTEEGEYVVFVLSQVSDERGGAAPLDVVAAESAAAPGAPAGSGTGAGADASVLPNGGSPVAPWSLWLALAATVFGASLVRFGMSRRANA